MARIIQLDKKAIKKYLPSQYRYLTECLDVESDEYLPVAYVGFWAWVENKEVRCMSKDREEVEVMAKTVMVRRKIDAALRALSIVNSNRLQNSEFKTKHKSRTFSQLNKLRAELRAI